MIGGPRRNVALSSEGQCGPLLDVLFRLTNNLRAARGAKQMTATASFVLSDMLMMPLEQRATPGGQLYIRALFQVYQSPPAGSISISTFRAFDRCDGNACHDNLRLHLTLQLLA